MKFSSVPYGLFINKFTSSWHLLLSLLFGFLIPLSVVAVSEEYWTLSTTIDRMQEQAPELRAAEADVNSSRFGLEKSGTWENPTLEIEASNAMGIDDGEGGYDPTRFAITQALGFANKSRQKDVAESEHKSKISQYRYQTLIVQNKAAHLFYDLQLTQANYQLANERLHLADALLNSNPSDPLVRYLHPAEKVRLSILREQAQQALMDAKFSWDAAQFSFRATLNLPEQKTLLLAELKELPAKPQLQNKDEVLNSHPELLSANYEREAAQKRIALAKAESLNAPELTLYQERDYLAGARENISGIALSLQVPIWNSSKNSSAKASADYERASAEYISLQRNLQMDVELQQKKLTQLIETTQRFRTQMLEPTEKLLGITRRSFASDETDVLSLVDANNSYFEARADYLVLLHNTWLTAADLKLAAGISLVTEDEQISGEKP